MEFTIPLPNGDYTVNLFVGNSYTGTSQPGDRIFDILVEGSLVQDDLDLVATFGHKVAFTGIWTALLILSWRPLSNLLKKNKAASL